MTRTVGAEGIGGRFGADEDMEAAEEASLACGEESGRERAESCHRGIWRTVVVVAYPRVDENARAPRRARDSGRRRDMVAYGKKCDDEVGQLGGKVEAERRAEMGLGGHVM